MASVAVVVVTVVVSILLMLLVVSVILFLVHYRPWSESVNREDGLPVYICLTTTPGRLSKISQTLDALVKVKNASVILSLPKDRFKEEDFVELAGREDIMISRPDKDLGPATKILGALESIKEEDAVVVIVDDDISYPAYALARLAEDANNKHVVATRIWKHGDEDVFTAHFGVSALKSHFIDNLDIIKNPPHDACIRGDDYWLSHCLREHGEIDIKKHHSSSFGRVWTDVAMLISKTRGFVQAAKGKAKSNQQNYDVCQEAIVNKKKNQ
jgi:hypothetical protein